MKIDTLYFDKDYFIGGKKSYYLDYGIAHDLPKRCEDIIWRYKPKRLLDVGCAYGFFVGYFRSKGIDAYGIDISDFAISKAHDLAKGYIFIANATDIPFPDGFFDLVFSFDTLEHIPEEDILKATDEIKRVGARQYHVIATVPEENDLDKSHITMKPINWWKQFLPDAELIGSMGEVI